MQSVPSHLVDKTPPLADVGKTSSEPSIQHSYSATLLFKPKLSLESEEIGPCFFSKIYEQDPDIQNSQIWLQPW